MKKQFKKDDRVKLVKVFTTVENIVEGNITGKIVETRTYKGEEYFKVKFDEGVKPPTFETWFYGKELELIKERNVIEVLEKSFKQGVYLNIVKVIHSNPATIIFYKNRKGEIKKSVARCSPLDIYDMDSGVRIATMKALLKELPKMIEEESQGQLQGTWKTFEEVFR